MSIYENLEPINLEKINTYNLAERPSKVTVKDFAVPVSESDSLKSFLDKLPDILAVQSLREIARQIRRAKDLHKPCVLGIGGHIIKTGLAPVLIDLMERGFVTAIAGNGSVLVHDTEIALVGFTSEDVDASLGKGDFGAARETGEILNEAAKKGQQDKIGLGEAMGREVVAMNPPNAAQSLLCAAYKHKIPFTAHLGNRRRHRTFSRFGRRRGSRRNFAHRFSSVLLARQRIKRRRRLFKSRFGGDDARNFLESHNGCAKFRFSARRFYDRQFRFYPTLSSFDECRSPSDRQRRRSRIFHHRTSRNYDSASRRANFM